MRGALKIGTEEDITAEQERGLERRKSCAAKLHTAAILSACLNATCGFFFVIFFAEGLLCCAMSTCLCVCARVCAYAGVAVAVSHDEVEGGTGLTPVPVHGAAAVLEHLLAQVCTLLRLLLKQQVPKLRTGNVDNTR